MKQVRHRKILILIGILVITSVACSCGAFNRITNQLPVGLDDLNPDGIATAVAEQLPEMTITVEDLFEEGSEGSGDENLPPVAEDRIFSDLESSMEGLESYRTRILMSVDGQDTNGNPVQESVRMFQEAIQYQNAYHMIIESENTTLSTLERFEIFSIGDSFYMFDPQDQMGLGTPCFAMTGSTDMEDEFEAFEMISPDELFDEIQGGKLVKRGEMMNGVKTDHYQLKNVSMAESSVVTESGDIWIAQNGGFIVRFVGDGKGEAVMFSGSGNINGKMHWEYDLLDINAVDNIPLPVECVEAQEEGVNNMPVPPNATDVAQFGPMMTLNSPDAPDVVAEFYKQEMSALGYVLEDDSNFGNMFMYTFVMGEETLNVIITEGEAGGSTVVVTTETF